MVWEKEEDDEKDEDDTSKSEGSKKKERKGENLEERLEKFAKEKEETVNLVLHSHIDSMLA